jgi:hypothetical protein
VVQVPVQLFKLLPPHQYVTVQIECGPDDVACFTIRPSLINASFCRLPNESPCGHSNTSTITELRLRASMVERRSCSVGGGHPASTGGWDASSEAPR